MITLFRWILLKQKEIKWKLAFYQFLDKQLIGIIKDPESIEKKVLPYLAEIIHSTAQNATENK